MLRRVDALPPAPSGGRPARLLERDPLVDRIEGQGDAEFGDLERPLAVDDLPAPLALTRVAPEHADTASLGLDDRVAEDGGHLLVFVNLVVFIPAPVLASR